MKRNSIGGFGFYMALMLVIFAVYMIARLASVANVDYNLTDFTKDLTQGKVAECAVVQNKEVPTGYVKLTLQGETAAIKFYVSDVNEALDLLQAVGKDYTGLH